MHNRQAPIGAALIVASLLIAGCGSSSETLAEATATPATSPATSAPPSSTAGVLPAADCAIIKPIAAGAFTTLAPLQTESKSAAAATMTKYLKKLGTALGKLTSPQAKTDLTALISALKQANSPSSASAITVAVGKLGTDCP